MYTYKEALNTYNSGFDESKNFTSQLISIALYMRDYLNYKPQKIKEELYKFASEHKSDFNKNLEYKYIRKALTVAKNKKSKLIENTEVFIYSGELKYLDSLRIKPTLKQILFALLFIYKKNKLICDNCGIEKNLYNITLYNKLSYIKKSACINSANVYFCKMLQKLENYNLVTNLRLIQLSCDFIGMIPESSEIVYKIDISCENSALYYLMHCGNKYIKFCTICNKIYRANHYKQLYCKQCLPEHLRKKVEKCRKNKLDKNKII